jgi:integrase
MSGLTVRKLETIKADTVRQEVPDAYLRGLYFIVQPTGAKCWAVRYRFGGRSRKYTIGPYPAVDLVSARKLGAAALRAVAEGRDPFEAKRQLATARGNSVAAVAAQFVERYCKRKHRPRTLYDAQRYLNKYILPKWGNRQIGEITRRDVRDLLECVVDESPVTANRLHSQVRKLFNWAVEHDIVAASPVAGVKPLADESARERTLTDPEIRQVWRGAKEMGWPFGPLVHLLLLTAQRRGEVAGMLWSEVDLDNALWTLPGTRTKNKQTHAVPLSHQAVAILKKLPRIGSSPYVFSFNGRNPVNSWTYHKKGLDIASGLDDWTLHDLRRTAASGMARLGVSLPVIEKCLNHISGSFAGIVSVYQRHDFADEKAKAMQKWGGHVVAIVNGA